MRRQANGWGIMCSNAGQSRRPKVHVTTIRLLRIVVAVVTVWSAVLPTTAALPLEEFYPFDLQNDNKTEVTDDGGSGSIQLDAGFPFFNKTHNSIYVSTIKHTENHHYGELIFVCTVITSRLKWPHHQNTRLIIILQTMHLLIHVVLLLTVFFMNAFITRYKAGLI